MRVLLLMLLIACASTGVNTAPTVRIKNDGLYDIRLYNRGAYITTVSAGRTKCIKLYTSSGKENLKLQTIQGEATTPDVFFQMYKGWKLDISTLGLKFDAISLVPDVKC